MTDLNTPSNSSGNTHSTAELVERMCEAAQSVEYESQLGSVSAWKAATEKFEALQAAVADRLQHQDRLREAHFDELVKAYTAGATDVHNHWAEHFGEQVGHEERQGGPDFTEAAHDYARALTQSGNECPVCQGRGEVWSQAPGLPRAPDPVQCDACCGRGSQ